jgi:hypothetical protein
VGLFWSCATTRERVIPEDSTGRNGHVYSHIARTDKTDRQTKQAIKLATIEEKQPKERKIGIIIPIFFFIQHHRIKQASVQGVYLTRATSRKTQATGKKKI